MPRWSSVAAWLAALPLAIGACGEGGAAAVAPPTHYSEVAKTLEGFIRREMTDKELPAVSIALVDGNQIAWATGFGYANPADSTRATAETLYRVGSIAKLITAIGVMQQVEKGEIDLDQPVEHYLPEFHPANAVGGMITVRQLLGHRSGLPRELPRGSYFDSSRTSLADAVTSLGQAQPVFPPGSRTKYSNAGMTVAGYLVERQRGQSFARAMQGTVLDPLEMSHSTFAPDLSLDRSLARGFQWSYDGRITPAPRFEVGVPPAVGLYSTVRDLGRLISVLIEGGAARGSQVLKPETIGSMWRPASADSFSGMMFGLGFQISDRDGVRWAGQGASFGGNSIELALIPEDHLGVVVVTNKEGANTVTARIADAALALMRATKRKESPPIIPITQPINPGLAKRLDGSYGASVSRPAVELEERNGHLFYHRVDGETWLELRAVGDTLVTDDRLGFGERVLPVRDRIVVGRDTLARIPAAKPAAAGEAWRGLIGEYGPDFNIVYVREERGRLHLLVHSFFDYPLTQESADVYRFPERGLYEGERVRFTRGTNGKATSISVGGVELAHRAISPDDGSTFKITPLRPADVLVKEALVATPPTETGDFLKPDLVEVAKLDPTIKLDMRYATTNNFVSTAFYREGRAFAQRPAAEAMVRANRKLRKLGYGLLIHDSYRPWYVTKMFWDATPEDKRVFVANPANGSRHNRGCAIDLTLYDLKTGRPIEMVSGYDEFSDRAYPDYPGGTELQRWHRKLLRRAMEAEGFTVFSAEWWHFDYKDWRKYPILNVKFEDIPK